MRGWACRGTWAGSLAGLALIAFVSISLRSVIFAPGVPIFGDWVPPATTYVHQLTTVWNSWAGGGEFNVNLRLAPWLIPLAWAAGNPGAPAFYAVAKLVVFAMAAAPAASLWICARRTLRLRVIPALIAAAYFGFNPWITAQFASGHEGIVFGYALLPWVVWIALRGGTQKRVIGGSILLAAEAALDVHMATIAAIVLVGSIVAGATLGRVKEGFVVLVLLSLSTLALAAYWVLPWVMFAHLARSFPTAAVGIQPPAATLYVRGTILSAVEARAFWWKPFSSAFYTVGSSGSLVRGALVVGPAAAVVFGLSLAVRRRSQRLLGLGLVLVGLVPVFWAYYFRAAYLSLLHLPFGAVGRDPTYSTPLYVAGVLILAHAVYAGPGSLTGGCARVGVTRRGAGGWNNWPRYVVMGAMAISVVGSATPWVTGAVDGVVTPRQIADGQLRATAWLSAPGRARSLSLWLPTDNYQQYPWSGGTNVTDPVAYWSGGHSVNPYVQSVYSGDTQNAMALMTIQELLAGQLPGGYPSILRVKGGLVRMLGVAGIKYVAVRGDALVPAGVSSAILGLLRSAPGLKLVASFGSTRIFAVEGLTPPRSLVGTSGATIFGGSWTALAEAAAVGFALQPPFVAASPAAWQAAVETPHIGAVTDTVWAAIFSQASATLPPVGGRDALDWGVMPGYLFQRGTRIRVHARGLVALHVLAPTASVTMQCKGASTRPAIDEQPVVFPRWIAARCIGSVVLSFRGPVWLYGIVDATAQQYRQWRARVLEVLQHPGSGFVLRGRDFVIQPIPAPHGVVDTLTSYAGNPLTLGSGHWRVYVTCATTCTGNAAVRLAPMVGVSLAPWVVLRRRAGSSLYAGTLVVTAAGAFELSVRGRAPLDLAQVAVVRSPSKRGTSRRAAMPQWGQRVYVGPSDILSVPFAEGPWSVSGNHRRVSNGLSTDMLDTAYVLGWPPVRSVVSLTVIRDVSAAGDLITLCAWMGLCGTACVKLSRRRSRRAGAGMRSR